MTNPVEQAKDGSGKQADQRPDHSPDGFSRDSVAPGNSLRAYMNVPGKRNRKMRELCSEEKRLSGLTVQITQTTHECVGASSAATRG